MPRAAAKSPKASKTESTTTHSHISINLALQGGGSHGAYSWGVLDALLEDGRLEFEGISSTSAGAVNAVLLADGLAAGGRDGARELLQKFWERLANKGAFYPMQSKAMESYMAQSRAAQTMALDWMTHFFSPAQLNPFDFNPLRELLEEMVDFKRVQKQKNVKLFVNATNVRNGKIKVFETKDITLDTIMASACLPMIFKAVEIKGEAYWDGGYSGNPAIFPLVYGCGSQDVLLVQVTPLTTDLIPDSAAEIVDRLNEISFNATLMREMRAIAFVTDLIREGKVHDDEYKDMRMHRIASEKEIRAYNAASKLVADWTMISALFQLGRKAGQKWLRADLKHVGVKSSMNIKKLFL